MKRLRAREETHPRDRILPIMAVQIDFIDPTQEDLTFETLSPESKKVKGRSLTEPVWNILLKLRPLLYLSSYGPHLSQKNELLNC